MQKNMILKSTAALMAILFVTASFLPEEAGWLGFILTIIPFTWLMLFDFANGGDDNVQYRTK